MLYIYVTGDPEGCIFNVESYFRLKKKKDWFNREDVKKVIYDIDSTIAVKDEYLESPVFGGMAPERLSTGCKAVILMLVTDEMIYATKCGDNCIPSILEIAETKDIRICLHHCMPFPLEFHAIMADSGKEVHVWEEFVDEYYKARRARR